jgi:GT2 family glycosyltransferase
VTFSDPTPFSDPMTFSVIMACHNRSALTVRAIERAQAAADHAAIEITFTVFDDGSTDGTAVALSALSSATTVLHGDGTMFWARSMALAEKAVLATAQKSGDFVVWLNDDVTVDLTAFQLLRQTIDQHPGSVVVSAMREPSTGVLTYSGLRRDGRHPLSYGLVPASQASQRVETFNGNLVVVPVQVARRLRGIDGGFSHAFADVDYGLRCGRAGVPVILAPGTQGTCAHDPAPARGTAREDWRSFTGPKGGGNYRSVRRILRRSNRLTWPLVVAATYGLWWGRRITPAHISTTTTP